MTEIFLEIAAYEDRTIARRADGRHVALPFHRTLEASPVLGKPVGQLRASATILATAAPGILANLSAVGWRKAFAERHAAPTLQAARALHAATLTQAGELEQWRNNMVRSPAADPLIASETRAWLRTLKTGEAAKTALEMPEIAAAALQAWHLTGLPATLREQVENALIRHRLVASYSNAYRSQPDGNNPFAAGPDHAAAERAAAEAIATQETRHAETDTAKALFNSTVDFIALVGDVSRDAAFTMIAEAA